MNKITKKIIFYILIITLCLILTFPIYWMFNTSISPVNELKTYPPLLFPNRPQFGVFFKIFNERDIFNWMYNSTVAAFCSTFISLVVSTLAAYSLSRFNFKGNQSLGIFILLSKMLPTTLMVIPLFVIFRQIGLVGSLWSIVLAHATFIIPFATWMLKGYFDTIPVDLEQAAMIDGCNVLQALYLIVLPVSAPGIAATALYGFVLSWNEFAYARTFLVINQNSWTINIGIETFQGEYFTPWNEIMAASLIVCIPVIFVYLFLEKYLVSGLTSGFTK